MFGKIKKVILAKLANSLEGIGQNLMVLATTIRESAGVSERECNCFVCAFEREIASRRGRLAVVFIPFRKADFADPFGIPDINGPSEEKPN